MPQKNEDLDLDMIENLDLLLDMEVLEEEDNWHAAEESISNIDEEE